MKKDPNQTIEIPANETGIFSVAKHAPMNNLLDSFAKKICFRLDGQNVRLRRKRTATHWSCFTQFEILIMKNRFPLIWPILFKIFPWIERV